MPSTSRNKPNQLKEQQVMPISKLDPMVSLFRREVISFLSTAPSSANGIFDERIEVLATIERLSNKGEQSSLQLCKLGDQSWVTRTEGGREYFPRVGRVQKRVRVDDEEMGEEGGDKVGELNKEEDETPIRAKGGKSKSTPTTVKNSKHQRGTIPKAPKKSKSNPNIHHHRPTSVSEFSEVESTASSTEMLMRRNVEEALGRGSKRRCSARTATDELVVKAEEQDDLASLCGRVDGLEVKSCIDTESEYGGSVFSDYKPSAGPGPASNLFSANVKAGNDGRKVTV